MCASPPIGSPEEENQALMSEPPKRAREDFENTALVRAAGGGAPGEPTDTLLYTVRRDYRLEDGSSGSRSWSG